MAPTRYELDTAPAPVRSTSAGISTLLPGPVAPLTWTTAGAAIEFAMRIACCSTLPLLPWPRPGREWAMTALVDGRGVFDADLLDEATLRIAEHPRRTALRAARARRAAERRGDAGLVLATAMRDGRSFQVMSERTVDDLLLTSSRLLDVLFRVLADHAGTSLVGRVSRREVATGADIASAVALDRPLPLWQLEAPGAGVTRTVGERPGPAGAAAAIAAAELKATVDELGRRWSETPALDAGVDVAYLRWDELPEVAGGRIDAAGCHERVSRRKAQLTECSSEHAS